MEIPLPFFREFCYGNEFLLANPACIDIFTEKIYPMFGRRYIFLILALFSVKIFSQADSLQHALQTTKEPKAKARILMELADYWSFRDTTKAKALLLQTGKIIEGDAFLLGLKEFYTAGIYFDRDIEKSEKHYLRAEQYLKDIPTKESYTFQARIWHNFGTLQQYKGDPKSLMDITLKKCIPLAEKAQNNMLLSSYLTDVGMLFYNFKEYQKSVNYYMKALAVLEKTKGKGESKAWIYLNMANTHLMMDKIVQAKNDITEAQDALASLPQSQYNALLYQVKSKYFNKLGEQRLALENIEKGIDVATDLNLDYDLQTLMYEKYQILKTNKNYSEAEHILLSLLNNKKFRPQLENRLIFLRELSALYAAQGKYRQAYERQNQSIFLSDSLQDENEKMQIVSIESKYNNEKKEKEMIILKNKSHQQKIIISAVASLLLLGCAFVIYAINQKKKRTEHRLKNLEHLKKIDISRALTEGEEQERERLAKDLHDGLGGRLTGIKMNLEHLAKNQETGSELKKQVRELDKSLAELRQTARNLMPETLIKFGLEDALKDYCINMQNEKTRINFYGNNLNNTTDKKKQLNIYRIIQELVNNAIRHAEATLVLVQCTVEGSLLLITVEDDGKGFDTAERNHTLGLRNIEKRVQMLNGTIVTESATNHGTVINIECHI